MFLLTDDRKDGLGRLDRKNDTIEYLIHMTCRFGLLTIPLKLVITPTAERAMIIIPILHTHTITLRYYCRIIIT